MTTINAMNGGGGTEPAPGPVPSAGQQPAAGAGAADRAADHAVVLGAGMAGLLAARVLAERFPHVTLVERDPLDGEAPGFRPGVPQSRHCHVLWSRGIHLLESLLPGIRAELEAAGARELQTPRDFLWLSPADWFAPVPGATVLSGSRELLDWTVRRAVLRDGRVRLLAGAEATGLLATPDGRAVRGVTLRARRGAPDVPAELRAHFVADASGRTSRAPDWLAALGHPAPAVTRYDSHLAYSSRCYEGLSETGRGWQGMYIQGRPDTPRGGVLLPLEGGRWMATLIGNGRHAPPTADGAFLDYARSLRSAALYEALREAKPLSSATAFRATANEWRHYERLDRQPDGFVVLGDAACRFNPVYGHGMTVAATAAEALGAALRGLPVREVPAAAGRIQRAIAATAEVPWQIATSEDLRYPETEGPPPDRATKVMQRYMARVTAGANRDPEIAGRFFGVLSLTAPPQTLLSPATVVRVLANWRLPTAPATPDYPPHHRPPAPRPPAPVD
ncbi:NAD(P)/FAD-dependent oxidoreductase [Streptomyces sp. NPDC093225]|uniref:NAD(P)/FAD-dependent oxidoreductase n=1 Tax=Streptomyces sp. NPDC093225 TaxID=3366034 RepID=UPI00381FA519